MDKAILLAVAASLCTATASLCQRKGARSTQTAGFDVRLVVRLARQPVWLLGIASLIGGFIFQLTALRSGGLALVQPILAAELLFVFGYLAVAGSRRVQRRDWLAAAAMSAGHLNVTLAHPGVLRGVLAAGFYLAVMAWVGLGLGAVSRHTAGAITTLIGVVFLLPHVIQALPAPWDIRIGKYSLDIAAQQVIAQHPAAVYFPAGPSFLIVAGYAAVAIAAAALLVTRRDA